MQRAPARDAGPRRRGRPAALTLGPLLVSLGCADPPDEVVVRLVVRDAADLAAAEALGDVWTEHVEDHVDVRMPRSRMPPGATPWIDDLPAAVEVSMASDGSGPFQEWLPLDALQDHLSSLAEAPGARLVVLGTSVEGRPLQGLRVGRGAAGALVVGAQHAREWVAASSALYVAEQLVTSTDPRVAALLDAYEVLVVPVANPDGYEYTWTTDRFWRKNRQDNGDGSFGVDLNRNWDAAWGGVGGSPRTTSDNYAGAAAFSEPETAALRDFLLDHPSFRVHLDLHCTGQLALHPFASTPDDGPDEAVLAAATLAAAVAMSELHGASYRSGSFNEGLYPASGVAIDWSYEALDTTSALFELRDRGQYGFLLPTDQIEPTGAEALEGLLALVAADAGRP